MEVLTTTRRKLTAGQLKRLLFDTKRRRRWYINARIRTQRLSHDPLELGEQLPELGPVIVFAVPPYHGALREDHVIVREAALVAAADIDSKRTAAYDWLKTVSARGIVAIVVIYTLTPDGRDFATMELLEVPWLPEEIKSGDRIRYRGIAHPFPGATAICLNVDGVFEITDIALGPDNTLWWQVHDLQVGDDLYLSGPLLLTAVFLNGDGQPEL
jgi:hypothetical protein